MTDFTEDFKTRDRVLDLYNEGFNDAKKLAAELVLRDRTTTNSGHVTPYIEQYNKTIEKLAADILAL